MNQITYNVINMKRVLLTGASGFIGRQTIPFLLKKGYEIHAVIHNTKISELNKGKNILYHRCNLLDFKEQYKMICKIRPTHLLHFAWYTKPCDYLTSLENIEWFNASLNLLYNFEMCGGDRAVCAGTCIENTESPYAICKTNLRDSLDIMSRYLDTYADVSFNLSYAWGRIFYPYGIYEKQERLISYIINSLLQNNKTFCTDGEQIRDLMYVEDVANAFVTLLDSDAEGEFNICSGNPVKLKDVIEFIGKKLDKENLIRLGALEYRENEMMKITGCPDRLKKELKWSPKYSLNEGLDKTIEWWRRYLEK